MKLFSILKKDLLILLRDRAQMAVLFLMPLAFILPVSFALGKGDGYGINRDYQMILLPVVNYDGGSRAQEFLTTIGESLRLEISHEPELIQALGLAEDPDCAPGGPAPQGTGTPDETAPAESAGDTIETPANDATPANPQLETPNGATAIEPTGGAESTQSVVPVPTAEETVAATDTPETGSPEDAGPVPLTSQVCSEKVAQAMLLHSWRAAALIIPPGFSDHVDAGRETWVTLLLDPTGDSIRAQQIAGVVKSATIKLSLRAQVVEGMNQIAELAAFAPGDLRAAIETQAKQPVTQEQQPAIRLVRAEPENYTLSRTPNTYQQTIPGYTVMYVFFIIPALAGSLRQERLNGTFRRLLSLPVSRFELLGGKLLATMVVGVAQVAVLFMVGMALFDLQLGPDLAGLFFLTAALVTTATAIGLAASTTSLKGSGLAAPLIIAALLGGCLFPLDLMPPFMRTLSQFVPHSWALNGFQDLMVRDQDIQAILPNIGVLLAFALAFFLIAIARLDFKE